MKRSKFFFDVVAFMLLDNFNDIEKQPSKIIASEPVDAYAHVFELLSQLYTRMFDLTYRDHAVTDSLDSYTEAVM